MARKSLPVPEPRSISARDVADRAKVSVSTVSRVFRDQDNVAPKTVARIMEVARELGYRPNLAARALRTGQAQAVGFIHRSPFGLRGEFHGKSFGGFQAAISPTGYHPVVAGAVDFAEILERASELIQAHQCRGIVVQGDFLRENQVKELGRLGTPVVVLNYDGRGASLPPLVSTVGFDNVQGVAFAVHHLVSLGHRRLAFIGGTPETNDAGSRERGFRETAKALSLPLREEWIRSGHFGDSAGGFESGTRAMEFLLSANNGPTAIMCASDEIAVGAMNAIRRGGRGVPHDFSVVGFDDHSWSQHLEPALTTVSHDGWELGTRAWELLRAGVLERGSSRTEVIPTRLVARSSTARPH